MVVGVVCCLYYKRARYGWRKWEWVWFFGGDEFENQVGDCHNKFKGVGVWVE